MAALRREGRTPRVGSGGGLSFAAVRRVAACSYHQPLT